MQFQLTFKTPDVTDQAPAPEDEEASAAIARVLKKFVRRHEYLIVEFDSEKRTARVVEVRKVVFPLPRG
jgi:hypothetical protein